MQQVQPEFGIFLTSIPVTNMRSGTTLQILFGAMTTGLYKQKKAVLKKTT